MIPKIVVEICVILLWAVLRTETVYNDPTVKITNIICETKNKTWLTVDYCRLRAVSRYKTTLTAELTIHYPAYNIDLQFQMLKKANGYKPWLFNFRIDGCAFMRKANHPVVKILLDIIKDYSNLIHTCPYVNKQTLKDFFWDPRNLTLPIPTGEYLIIITWIFDKRTQFVAKFYFTFNQDLMKD